MTAKTFLEQAQYLKAKIQSLNKELGELDVKDRDCLKSSLSNCEGGFSPNRSTEAPYVKRVEWIDMRERSIRKELECLNQKLLKIMETLDDLKDPSESELLRYRYVDGLEWKFVARRMRMSVRTAYRVHTCALIDLDELLENMGF